MRGLSCEAEILACTEDVEAGLVTWQVACNTRLNNGRKMWVFGSESEGKVLAPLQRDSFQCRIHRGTLTMT